MESKELIQSYFHAKAWSFICSRLENLWGGGGVRMTPPPLGWFVTVNSLVVRGLRNKLKILKHAFQTRGYQETQINNTLAEMNFDNRSAALQQKPKTRNKILSFVTKYNPAAPNVK